MKVKPILISVAILVLLFFGGIFYYASHRINGEELKKFVTLSLKEVFPQAKVDVGKIRLNFGSSLNLTVEGFSLALAEKQWASQRSLFKVNRVMIEIPLWSVLGFDQSITIKLDGPHVSFERSKGKSNWSMASKGDPKRTRPSASHGTAMVPAFLANGRFNLKFTDTRLNYNLENSQKGSVLIEYFRVNNLGFKSDAAYELKSDVSLKFSEQIMDMGLSLIGQFSPAEFIREGTLRTTSILMVNNIYLPSQDISVPSFKTDIKLELANTGEVTARLAATLNEKNQLNALVKTRDEGLSVENMDVIFYLGELLDILKIDIPSLNVGDGRIELKGGFSLDSQFRPNLTFSIGPQIKYSHNDMLFNGDMKGKYQGRSLAVGINSKGLNGSLYGDLFIDMDIGKHPIVLSQLPPFKFSIIANDLLIPPEIIQNAFYVDSNKTSDKKEVEKKFFLLPKGAIDFNFKNIHLGGNPLSVKGGIKVDNKKVTSSNIQVTTFDGETNVSFESHLYREGIKNRFSMELNDMNLKDVSVFYPKWLGVLEGVSSGKIHGTLSNLNKQLNYNVNLGLKIWNGHWHGMDLSEYTRKIIDDLSSVPSLGSEIKGKSLKISSKFEKASLKGDFSHKRWDLKRYSFVGDDLSLEGGKGRIYPPPSNQKSVLPVEVDWKYLRPVMSRKFVRNSLPLRLSGVGFALKPDISFVTKKLSRGLMKKRSGKVIKKLEKKIHQNSEGNVKDLFKGLL